MKIGPYQLSMPVVLAPMAGITDLPFRHMVHRYGVGMTVAEMVSARPDLQHSRKHRQRRISLDEPLPRAIQIVGHEPAEMAQAAVFNQSLGAGLIDINMGCPAKKVCRKAAGSALLGDPRRVRSILRAVVAAVEVPVTLKIRTGLTPEHNNAIEIARIAEEEGIQSLAVHGRSRACLFGGAAEYETIRRVKQAVSIPVIANGDIDSPGKALRVMRMTGADAVMVGRAAQGRPWLPRQIGRFLQTDGREILDQPGLSEQKQACLEHLNLLHDYYGGTMGVKIARKHVKAYLQGLDDGPELVTRINRLDDPVQVEASLRDYYDRRIDAAQRVETRPRMAA